MAKEPFPIFKIGRILVALYIAHLLVVFVLWARDHSTVNTRHEEVTRGFKTHIQFRLKRGTDPELAFVPVVGVLDRMQWRMGVSIDNGPWTWFEIDSPEDFPFEDTPETDRILITESPYEVVIEGTDGLMVTVEKAGV